MFRTQHSIHQKIYAIIRYGQRNVTQIVLYIQRLDCNFFSHYLLTDTTRQHQCFLIKYSFKKTKGKE